MVLKSCINNARCGSSSIIVVEFFKVKSDLSIMTSHFTTTHYIACLYHYEWFMDLNQPMNQLFMWRTALRPTRLKSHRKKKIYNFGYIDWLLIFQVLLRQVVTTQLIPSHLSDIFRAYTKAYILFKRQNYF